MKHISKLLNKNKHTDSPIEELLYGELCNLGLKPRVQYELYPFFVDLAFPDIKLAIEADGRQWHSTRKQKGKDAYRDKVFKKHGWKVERFPGELLYRNADLAAAKIALQYFRDSLTKEQEEKALGSVVRYFTTDRKHRDIYLAMAITDEYFR